MATSPKSPSLWRVSNVRLAARTIVTGVLSWFLLFAWDVLIGEEQTYLTLGKVYLPAAGTSGDQNAALKPEHLVILQSHETALMSQDLRRRAQNRVHLAHPELDPENVKLHSNFSMHKGMPLIELSNISTSPTYPAAFINELVWEHIAELKREREQTPSYQAYLAAVGPVLDAQRDVVNLRTKLDSLPQDTILPSARDSITAELQEAEKRWELAKAILAQLPPEGDVPVIMYDKAYSEPYEHAMDPLTLLVHHPWRALASLALAGFLSLFLIPQSLGSRTSSICEGVPA
jgi:hypothetical protein